MKALFGFGDGRTGHNHASQRRGGQPHGIPIGDTSAYESAGNDENVNKLALRGFKYGLLNAIPTNTTAIYRHDTYGQYRDMLEQRLYTKLYQDEIDDDGLITDLKVLGEAAIDIKFRPRLNPEETVKPAATNSQNLSAFYTSSMPYFDDQTKDRFDIQPDMSSSFVNE